MSTPREAPVPYDLAADVIVLRENSVLAVYEKDHWGLPKDDSKPGEFFFETTTREAAEETGAETEVQSLAFTSEIRAPGHRVYLQRSCHATPVADDPTPSPNGPDDEVEVAKFLPLIVPGSTLTYRPWVEPLRDWLQDRKPRHYTCDLTREPSDVEK